MTSNGRRKSLHPKNWPNGSSVTNSFAPTTSPSNFSDPCTGNRNRRRNTPPAAGTRRPSRSGVSVTPPDGKPCSATSETSTRTSTSSSRQDSLRSAMRTGTYTTPLPSASCSRSATRRGTSSASPAGPSTRKRMPKARSRPNTSTPKRRPSSKRAKSCSGISRHSASPPCATC